MAHRAFRVISTASKSLPLKDWLSDEHANMFFPVAAQPMSHAEEEHLLLQTGCPALVVDALLRFADRYRTSMTADAVQKNRKLGTRALMRIARRAAQFPSIEPDLYTLLSRAVLAEFLPATEAMNLLNICEETGITKRTPAVSSFPALAVRRPVRVRSRGSRTVLIVCVCLPMCRAVQPPARDPRRGRVVPTAKRASGQGLRCDVHPVLRPNPGPGGGVAYSAYGPLLRQ